MRGWPDCTGLLRDLGGERVPPSGQGVAQHGSEAGSEWGHASGKAGLEREAKKHMGARPGDLAFVL